MKRTTVIILLTLMGVALFASTSFGRGKPLSALIKGAKISIVGERADEALSLLDTALAEYGPVPEVYYLSARIYAEKKMDNASGLDAKRPHLAKVLAYIDSLHWACETEGVVEKDDYRDDCEEYISFADSTKVKYFRFFYNQGRDQLRSLEQLAEAKSNETDSARLAYIEYQIETNIDSVIANMNMAIMIDSSDYSPYVAIADAYDRAQNYEKAIEWMTQGYDRTEDPTLLAQQLAYYHIQMDDYCGAIPYFKQYVDANPDSLTTMNYLAACYNNCGLEPDKRYYLDSAMAIYRTILEVAPDNPSIWASGGRYFLVKAQEMSDSATVARSADDMETAEEYDSRRDEMFDSSRAYFAKAWEQDPDDAQIAEQFAFTSALLQDCEAAVKGFEVVAQVRPNDVNNWTSMGDCYLRMADYPNALRAYEKVAELNPNLRQIWENLVALYKQTNQKAKAAEAQKKLDELTSGQG